ncbi:hypothetical protein SLS60_003940 [Paraconiothyrium brasiliense]|uniref:Uncharacterized protein n=1 Tax=Paraconiothyrium brasiliense TaxID=300254 RepID=A0ABR3RQ24_9PLEO
MPDTTPDSSRPSIADFEVCYNANTISEAQVWDIVARWQGLREFQHLYVNSNVNAKFSGSPLVSMWDSTEGNIEDSPEILNIVDLARKGKSAVGNIDQTKFSLSFSAAATVRFYKALTNYWLATEAKKLAHQCSYTLLSSSLCLWERVQYIFDDRSGLQESLDVLEVYDFVCQFLCKHIDHVDKDSLDHWLYEQDWFMNEDLYFDNGYFITQLGAHLSPPDILELLFLTSVWEENEDGHRQTWSREKRRTYLQARGSFDSFAADHLVNDAGVAVMAPVIFFAVEHVEDACELQLREAFPEIRPRNIAVAWEQYRRTLWLPQLRGQFGSMSPRPLLAFITEVVESLKDDGSGLRRIA